MSTGSLIALIIAITGLLGTVPAIILAFRGKSAAKAARARAEYAVELLADHKSGDH